jgi:hypothetical protein
MKIGDLVRYRGWSNGSDKPGPLALIIAVQSENSKFHKRVRVMWVGNEIPIQAQIISVSRDRFSSWCAPKHFELISEY